MHMIIVVRMVIAIEVVEIILERLVIGSVISIHHSADVVLSYWLLNSLSILGATIPTRHRIK